jgi:hypothetical protein
MANYGSATSGALSGAATGASLGSFIPGIGTAIGAAGGGILGGLAGLFGGGAKKDKTRQFENLLPEQKNQLLNILQQMGALQGPQGSYGMAQNYLNDMISGSPEAYSRFAAPYETQFQEQTLPGIAERFAGLGGGLGGGALSSSGFAQALGGAGTQFRSNLAGLYAQLQQQAANQALGQYNNLASLGLGIRPFENAYQPGSTGFAGGAGAGLLQGIGAGIGQGFGTGLSGKIAAAMNNPNVGPTTGTTPASKTIQ